MASAPTWFSDKRIVCGLPLPSIKPSETTQPSAATSQFVSDRVSTSIGQAPGSPSLYLKEYIVAGVRVQPQPLRWPTLRRRDICRDITTPEPGQTQGSEQPMTDSNLLIDGKMVPGDLKMPVLNPATEEVVAQCPRASKEQLDKAVAAAKVAYPAWAATPIAERRKLVTKMADVIEANAG